MALSASITSIPVGTGTFGWLRDIIRKDSTTLYALSTSGWVNSTAESNSGMYMFKSSDNGQSWSLYPLYLRGYGTIWNEVRGAIDKNGDIQCVFPTFKSGNPIIATVKFATSSDTWFLSSSATVASVTLTVDFSINVAIDGTNKVHVIFRDFISSMGNSYYTTRYTNNVGGTYKTPVTIEGSTTQENSTPAHIVVNDSNIPLIMSYLYANTPCRISAWKGNANNATSFTQQIIFGAGGNGQTTPMFIINSASAVYAMFLNDTSSGPYERHISATGNWSSDWTASAQFTTYGWAGNAQWISAYTPYDNRVTTYGGVFDAVRPTKYSRWYDGDPNYIDRVYNETVGASMYLMYYQDYHGPALPSAYQRRIFVI